MNEKESSECRETKRRDKRGHSEDITHKEHVKRPGSSRKKEHYIRRHKNFNTDMEVPNRGEEIRYEGKKGSNRRNKSYSEVNVGRNEKKSLKRRYEINKEDMEQPLRRSNAMYDNCTEDHVRRNESKSLKRRYEITKEDIEKPLRRRNAMYDNGAEDHVRRNESKSLNRRYEINNEDSEQPLRRLYDNCTEELNEMKTRRNEKLRTNENKSISRRYEITKEDIEQPLKRSNAKYDNVTEDSESELERHRTSKQHKKQGDYEYYICASKSPVRNGKQTLHLTKL